MASNTASHKRIVSAVPLFASLDEDELAAIMQTARLFRAPAGKALVHEGEVGRGMFIIVAGEATVTVSQHDLPDTTLATLGRGDTVGELMLIDARPHSATVATTRESTLFFVERDGFDSLREAGHPAAYKVLRAVAPLICERLRAINERIGAIFANPEAAMEEIEQAYFQRAEANRLA